MHDTNTANVQDTLELESFEYSDFQQGESEVFDEAQEMELAAELVAVGDEAELDQFLGSLIKQAGQAVGKAVKGPIGRNLGGFLKGAAKKVLPAAAGALGTAIGGPVGGVLAGNAATAAGRVLGLELEGLSPEDQEFEAARQFVRFAGEAVKQASDIAGSAEPREAAKQAVSAAAKKLAPGLLRPAAGEAGRAQDGPAASGRWIRDGQRVVLLGL